MDRIGDERMPQCVHLDERRELSGVAEVVAVLTPGQRWAGGRLYASDCRVHAAGELLTEEWERKSAEVGPASGAADQNVRSLLDLCQLEERLLTDDRLVEEDMVQDASQCVTGVVALHRLFHRFRDGDAEAAGAVRVGSQDGPAGLGEI